MSGERTVWLSGALLTPLNKLVFPIVWLVFVAGVPLWVYATTGHLRVAPGFRFIVAFTLGATVFLVWLALRIEYVGYCGRKLAVAGYWRQAAIPFEHIEAVEPVWWYRGRLVRIRFNRTTPFGSVIYYLPKWGPLRALFSRPEEDLRSIISSPPWP